ncbi:Adhesion-like transmembrane protein [Operophtera brumata]|uniref:Adhesion-like transmembrane protein n=1 Tax=Operophtera brumata TaxID=104452 RepID=A0A0L7L5P1_OPEBR|nr:Adhesion-like transmembrane protein [Operophtera brumata]
MEKLLLITLSIITTIESNPVINPRQKVMLLADIDQLCSKLVVIDNMFFKFDIQKNVSGIPADMNVHWKTGNVFFTLISEEMKMNIVVLHNSGELEIIKVAGLGQSTSVDNLNDIVYLATDNGVYKYKDDGSFEQYTAIGEDVMYLTVSADGSAMFIATWPQNRVLKITNDGQKIELFPAIPNGHGLTIDTRDNIYFVATKTSYVLKNGESIPIKIKGLPSNKMTGIFVSRSDAVYAMDENSNLFIVNAETARYLGSFGIEGVNSFAMDAADNVLIGVKGAVLKFTALEQNPCIGYTKTENQEDTTEYKRHKSRHSHRKHARATTSTTEAVEEEYEEELEEE